MPLFREAICIQLRKFATAVELDDEYVEHEIAESKHELARAWYEFSHFEFLKKLPFNGELSETELDAIGNFDSFLEDNEWPDIKRETQRLLSFIKKDPDGPKGATVNSQG